ncbi:hypothetical protein MRB53_006407 [Persea americana]|uniref:Uncharacterized protein n=1 Tax=Persea americana TaxID=3435 RepID=A0ACC2MGA8_PERAE|nr:hypothetical protein MRB53_006407 [Persea americana]
MVASCKEQRQKLLRVLRGNQGGHGSCANFFIRECVLYLSQTCMRSKLITLSGNSFRCGRAQEQNTENRHRSFGRQSLGENNIPTLCKTVTRKQLNNPSALSLHLSLISRVLKWRMGKGSKIGCKMASHRLFKDKAKNWVNDLQGMFTDLQFARKESRSIDVAVLEEQVHQMLHEWKAELDEASPAPSLPHSLHLNALASTSKDFRIVKHESLTSVMQDDL